MTITDLTLFAAATLPLLFITIIILVTTNFLLRIAGKSTKKTIKTFTK